MSPLRIFYGGTFDPIHDGHLAIARAAHAAFAVTVRLMPAADPPHRPAPGADAGQRLQMLRLALAPEHGLGIEMRELQREGRSYSVDTLRGMRDEFGGDVPLALLVGADSFAGLPDWKAWRELFGLAHFIVADRSGSPFDGGPVAGALPAELAAVVEGRWADVPAELETAAAGRLYRLRQPLRAESASAIRRAIATGRPWRDKVPAAVADYILQQGLYGAGAAPVRR